MHCEEDSGWVEWSERVAPPRTPIMVTECVTDGRRIGELLSSELTARTDGPLSTLSVVNADSGAEASEQGTFAYVIAVEEDDGSNRLAEAFVHPDRLRIEFRTELDAVASAAAAADLRVRPTDDPPRVLVFVDDGAAVKRALGVIGVAL